MCCHALFQVFKPVEHDLDLGAAGVVWVELDAASRSRLGEVPMIRSGYRLRFAAGCGNSADRSAGGACKNDDAVPIPASQADSSTG